MRSWKGDMASDLKIKKCKRYDNCAMAVEDEICLNNKEAKKRCGIYNNR